MKSWPHLVLLLVGSLLAACRTSDRDALPNPPMARRPPAPAPGLTKEQLELLETAAGDYRLGGGDVVQFYTPEVPELARSFVLGPDDKLALPGLGVISLAGLTREAAAQAVETQLRTTYRNPKVTVLVEAYNNNRICILGQVQNPGQFNFAVRPFLLTALTQAGGLTATADLRHCAIVRGRTTLLELDLYELLRRGNLTLNLPLLPDDVIYVRTNDDRPFYVLGEVNRPGLFPTGEDMDPVHALALAGGDTRDANLSEVRILRRRPYGDPQVLDVNLETLIAGQATNLPTIEPGDILFVPRKGVATFNYYLNQVTPSLNAVLLGYTLRTIIRQPSP